MTDNEKTADPELEKEQKEIRQRLVRRIAVAIGLIGVAAISLPLLDKIRPESRRITPPPATDAQTTRLIGTTDKPAQPAPPALDTTETASAAPQQKPAEPVTTTEDNAADQAPAPPENPPSTGNESQPGQPISDSSPKTNGIRKQAAPISAAPPSEQPVPASKPQPITTQPLATKRPEAPRIEHPKPTAPTNPIEPIAPPPASAAQTHTPSPAGRSEQPTPPVVQRNKTITAQGYTVQLGVFANYANAKALQQKLAANGIPAQLETRVQLGPFSNKQEADDAYRRIKQLGLPAVIVGQ